MNPPASCAAVREALRDWLSLITKTGLFIVGGILVLAALLEMAVGTPWYARGGTALETFEKSPILVLLAGLLLAIPPLAIAFRDSLHAARQRRHGEP